MRIEKQIRRKTDEILEEEMRATIFSDDFNRIVDATKQFVSKVHCESWKAKEYIRFDFDAEHQKVTAMSLDGYRMSVENSVVSECDENFSVYIMGSFRLPRKTYAVIEKVGTEVQIRCAGALFGFEQPEDPQPFEWQKVIPEGEPHFKIGFNGNYLLTALQAAKISAGQTFKNPIVLEFWSPISPVIIRTNKDDIKMVLPIRLGGHES